MTEFTEGLHAGEYIAWEANQDLSRKTATVLSGQNLVAGEVLMLSGGKLVAHDGSLDSAGDVVTAAEGILYDAVDASATGHDADVADVVYTERLAVVVDSLITYPDESTAGGEKAAVQASLLLKNIKTI